MKRAEQRILVLQSGGSLGAYQAGVYEALAATALEPQWLAGVSSRAINAALIACNPPERRAERLREVVVMLPSANRLAGPCFDDPCIGQWFHSTCLALTTLIGLPGFYSPDGCVLNLRTRRLTAPARTSVALSNGEFSLLTALRGAPRRVLSCDRLLSMSQLHEAEVNAGTADVRVVRLLPKVEAQPTLIITQHRVS